MAKRVREEGTDGKYDLAIRIDNLEAYATELEWMVTTKSGGKKCSLVGCIRLVANDSGCDFCGTEPSVCVMCLPREFAHCTWDGDCHNYFCRAHGDIKAKKCNECMEEPEA